MLKVDSEYEVWNHGKRHDDELVVAPTMKDSHLLIRLSKKKKLLFTF